MALLPWKATTIPRAFALNALALGISIALTAFVGDLVGDKEKGKKLAVQVMVSSACLYVTFWLMHITFGYGGGQLAN